MNKQRVSIEVRCLCVKHMVSLEDSPLKLNRSVLFYFGMYFVGIRQYCSIIIISYGAFFLTSVLESEMYNNRSSFSSKIISTT